MINREALDQLARQIGGLFGQSQLPRDVEHNLRALMQGALAKMDVVTRDEFDAQSAVLARTRSRIEQLEKQLQELAVQLENPSPQ